MAPTSLIPPPRPEHRWRQNRNAARSFSWLLRKGHLSHLRRPLPASMWQISHRQDSPYGFRAPGGRGRKIRMNAGGNKWGLAPAPEGPWGVGRGSPGARRPQSATDARPRAGGPDTRKRRNALQRSVLFYMASLWHGGGANRSNAPRMGLINTYALGWLRQEVSRYFVVPPEVAIRYDKTIRRLPCYTKHGRMPGHGHRVGAARVPRMPGQDACTGPTCGSGTSDDLGPVIPATARSVADPQPRSSSACFRDPGSSLPTAFFPARV